MYGPEVTMKRLKRTSFFSYVIINIIIIFLMVCSTLAATTQVLTSPDTSDVFTTSTFNSLEKCPNRCQCQDFIVVCIDTQAVHMLSNDEISQMTLQYISNGNNFTRLEAESFVRLKRLQMLDMSNNCIESIEPNSLTGLSSLRELKLGDNKLNRVNWSLVIDFDNQVDILNLTRNSMDIVTSNYFRPLRMLRILDLSENNIGLINSNAFKDLQSLLVLDLSNNFIVDIEPNIFNGLDNLTELYLRGNNIRHLDSTTFTNVLRNLKQLNLSFNRIVSDYNFTNVFNGFNKLTHLALRNNNLDSIPVEFTRNMPELQTLDLGANPIVSLNKSQFSPGRNLQEIFVDNMIKLVAVMDDAFTDLPNLHLVNLSANIQLKYVSPNAFNYCPNLAILDFSNGGLQTLRGRLISQLTGLKKLALANNKWRCDCGLHWVSSMHINHPNVELMAPSESKCMEPPKAINESIVNFKNGYDCAPAVIVHHSKRVSFRLGSTALLECQVIGDPMSVIKWVTPGHEIFYWYPLNTETTLAEFHSSLHDTTLSRVQVLRNGNLFIGPVKPSDAGSYLCLADNSLGAAQSVTIAMRLDYDIIRHVKVVSLLVGVATSIAFLLAALIARLVQMILNRFGWCCCRGTLPPKAKHIKQMLESVEYYKKQQLDRLRDNYTMQVQRIKENCNQQIERIRDSYTQQTDRFRDIREYGTQQLNCMRDQYSEQVKRVRDYGVQQMSKVRENYVFQRNRVRKFRAHQLFKLRENYKVQQLHLNKILENLNLESCRTVCARTDSIVFTSETMESAFVGIVHGGNGRVRRFSQPLTDGSDILLKPFSFEMFDFASIEDKFPMDYDEDIGALDGSAPTPDFVTPPQSPIGSPLDADQYQLQSVINQSQSSDDSFADFDEMVTCVVIPKSSVKSTTKEDKTNTVLA